jgi:hypothetical protein
MGNFYTCSLLCAFRRLRTFVATPAKPVPSSSIVVGSGTVVIVPFNVFVPLVKLPGKNVTLPGPDSVPVAPLNKPVPPVMLNVNKLVATPFTAGAVVPLIVPKKVLPLAKSNEKSPFEISPVATLAQKLSVVVNAPKLEVPVPGLALTNTFGGNAPHRPTFGVAGGLLRIWRLPLNVIVSACVEAAAPRHSTTKVSVVSPILLS